MQVYLADFGLARKYTMDGKHKQYREEPAKAHDGTKEYTSIDAHRGLLGAPPPMMVPIGTPTMSWYRHDGNKTLLV